MKKLLLLLTVFFISVKAQAQVNGFYISPGSSYSNKAFSYGAEVGVYTDRVWLAIAASTSRDSDTKKWSTFVGIKPYIKFASIKEKVDLYGFYAIYVATYRPNPLQLEPGVAAVYNLGETLAVQVSGSLPLYTTNLIPSGKPSVSLGINFYFPKI